LITKTVLALMVFTILSPAFVYAVPGIFTVDLEETSVDVSFDAQGIEIKSAEADLDFGSLILEVEVSDSTGILEITFARNFFDATYAGSDDEFIILGDGFDELDYEETNTTLESRTLRIEIPNGTEEVEIIGTAFGEPEPPAPTTEPPAPTTEPPAPTTEPPAPTTEPTTPKTKCGPGTVLKGGVCVLEEKCGPGTILQDGVCVASPSSFTGPVSISKDFAVGGGFALGISFILMLIFGLIAMGSRQKS